MNFMDLLAIFVICVMAGWFMVFPFECIYAYLTCNKERRKS